MLVNSESGINYVILFPLPTRLKPDPGRWRVSWVPIWNWTGRCATPPRYGGCGKDGAPKLIGSERMGATCRPTLAVSGGRYSGRFAPSLAPSTAPLVVFSVLCQAFFVPRLVL